MQKGIKVVNIRHEEYDVYIGRAKGARGYLGNPFPKDAFLSALNKTYSEQIARELSFEMCLIAYTYYLYFRLATDKNFKRCVDGLKDIVPKNPDGILRVGCFCKKKDGTGRCHGDILRAYLQGQENNPYVTKRKT